MTCDDEVRAMLRAAAALVYVDDLADPSLAPEDAHHLGAVLRLRPGEAVAAGDGAGRVRPCVVERTVRPEHRRRGAGAADLVVRPTGDVAVLERAVPEVTVGFSLAKGDRTEWAVAKLSELGVDRIVPLVCERTSVRLGPAAVDRQMVRLRRIARESSMQARRAYLPEVLDITPFADALGQPWGPTALAEPGGGPLSLARPVVLVGPEGGYSEKEMASGLPTVGLGDTILRIETAAVVAAARLTGERSG